METITSRQNPQILRAVRLQDRKHRQREQLFCFDGIKLCKEALLSGVIPARFHNGSRVGANGTGTAGG